MNNETWEEFCKELLAKRDFRNLKTELEEQHPHDIAELLNDLEGDVEAVVFRLLSKDLAAEVFAYLESDARESLLSSFSDREVSDILDQLYIDDFVDMVEELPANAVTRVLQLASPEDRRLINHYLKYAEDSAGSIMTSEFTSLKKDMSVGEAIHHIRTRGQDRETIYTCYVMDQSRRLEGVLSVKDLLLSKDSEIVGDIMEPRVISVTTSEDQEEVLRLFNAYDFLSLPVVDQEHRLVGVITVDDVLDVAHQEATEDFEKMAALSPSEEPYLKSSVFELARHRFFWLLILMISGMINGSILGRYESAFLAMPLLVSFIPMLTDTGGNAGSQSSTLIIRGMALSEISFSDLGTIVWKELRVSLLVGMGLFVVNFLRIYFSFGHNLAVALSVSTALLAIVIISKLCGSVLPLLAKAIHLDPAIMAAPLITTIVDALGLIVYFNIAERILHL